MRHEPTRRGQRMRRFGLVGMCWLGLVGVLTVGVVAAQPAEAQPAEAQPTQAQPTQEEPSDDRSQAFVAMEGASQEDVAGGPLLVAAYGLVWLFVFAYLVVLARRTSRAEQDVARLSELLRQRAG